MTDKYIHSINGIISPSIASNNLTVALKNFDGTNFSASAIFVHKIGNVPRSLSSSLSVTVNAGANTFNAGASILATIDLDLFVYLGWRASNSSMFILISRIPYATTYGNFSATATNEKYGAYSGAAPASTDPVVNIGRFKARLSAGAGYTWSIPTVKVIHTPTQESDPLVWLPAVSAVAGSITSYSVNYAKYYISGQLCRIVADITITNNGTGATAVQYTAPFVNGGEQVIGKGREMSINGKMLQTILGASLDTVLIYNYDNTYPAGANYRLVTNTEYILTA
jgi:hypothetical protein